MERPPVAAFLRAVLFLVFLFQPALAPAQNFSLLSDTLMRMWEPEVDGSDDLSLPIYEYLQLDAGDRKTSPLTFHLYGWGRAELGDSDYFEEVYGGDTAGEVLYAYLQYARPEANLDVRLGRQYIFSGITDNSIDGLRVDTDLSSRFRLTAYAGRPVSVDSAEEIDSEIQTGGRLAHRWGNLYEIGVSYKNLDTGGDRELLGIDTAFFLPGGVNLTGFSSLDLGGSGWGEHNYQVSFNLGSFQVRPFFEHYRYQDYFDAGANNGGPFIFLVDLEEKLTVYGTDVLWDQKEWEFGLKGKYYEYDKRGDSSYFVSALAAKNWEGLSQVGAEIGRMEGDGGENDYLLTRAYVYWDQLPQGNIVRFLTGDVVYVLYDEDIYGEDHSFLLTVGAGRHFLDKRLDVRLAGDYSFDPYYDHDLRGWILARYAFDL